MIFIGVKYTWRHHKWILLLLVAGALSVLGVNTGIIADYFGTDRVTIRALGEPTGEMLSVSSIAYAEEQMEVDSAWTLHKIKGDYVIVVTYKERSWEVDFPALEKIEEYTDRRPKDE